MKKILSFVLAGIVCVELGVVAFAGGANPTVQPAQFFISGDSLMIAAPRVTSAPNWVQGKLYSHGDLVRSTNRHPRVYWNVSGTTNESPGAVMPTHMSGTQDDGGTNKWRSVPAQPRVGIIISSYGPTDSWGSIGVSAVASNGMHFPAWSGILFSGSELQEAIYMIRSDNSDTNLITTQEY